MTFNLIEKLKEELRFNQLDLVGYNNEIDALTNAKAEVHLELQEAYQTIDRKISDVSGSIAFTQNTINEYQKALELLVPAFGENNVNGQ